MVPDGRKCGSEFRVPFTVDTLLLRIVTLLVLINEMRRTRFCAPRTYKWTGLETEKHILQVFKLSSLDSTTLLFLFINPFQRVMVVVIPNGGGWDHAMPQNDEHLFR